MRAAALVGRVGGLAVAQGVGVAVEPLARGQLRDSRSESCARDRIPSLR